MIGRCCRDTLTWRTANMRGPFVVGTEIPCRWQCDCHWRFEDVAGGSPEWVHHDPLSARITKMFLDIHSDAYRARRDEVLTGKKDA